MINTSKGYLMNNRNCRKCGEHIPNWVKIDKKYRNLKNRKFCLVCSPFGEHNTKTDDPSAVRKNQWKDYTDEKKQKIKDCLYLKAKQRKRDLIEMLGGKCDCGYNKCLSALQFHHKNPEDKIFGLTLNNLWSKKWEIIVEEAKKCKLMCANCHAEEHQKTI